MRSSAFPRLRANNALLFCFLFSALLSNSFRFTRRCRQSFLLLLLLFYRDFASHIRCVSVHATHTHTPIDKPTHTHTPSCVCETERHTHLHFQLDLHVCKFGTIYSEPHSKQSLDNNFYFNLQCSTLNKNNKTHTNTNMPTLGITR